MQTDANGRFGPLFRYLIEVWKASGMDMSKVRRRQRVWPLPFYTGYRSCWLQETRNQELTARGSWGCDINHGQSFVDKIKVFFEDAGSGSFSLFRLYLCENSETSQGRHTLWVHCRLVFVPRHFLVNSLPM